MNVALIGYRGSGKTSVARVLAQRLGWRWCDADRELESRTGRTIRQIFEEQGETAFRDLESEILAELVTSESLVLALGGGVVLRPENRRMLRACRVVWLRAAPEVLHQRIQNDPASRSSRPNLTADGGLEEVRQMLAARESLYATCADYAVDTDEKSPDQIADEIVARLKS